MSLLLRHWPALLIGAAVIAIAFSLIWVGGEWQRRETLQDSIDTQERVDHAIRDSRRDGADWRDRLHSTGR